MPIYDIDVASAVIDMRACMKAYSDAALVQKIERRCLYETQGRFVMVKYQKNCHPGNKRWGVGLGLSWFDAGTGLASTKAMKSWALDEGLELRCELLPECLKPGV